MTAEEIINEAVEFYTKNPRSRFQDDNGLWSCSYYNPEDGRMMICKMFFWNDAGLTPEGHARVKYILEVANGI